MEVYNKNRDQNNSMHDEIREQNAKLKDAPIKDKLAYFKEYYLKTVILVAVVVIFLGHLVYTMISAPTDTAFAAFFYNDFGDSSSTELIDGFVAYQNIDTKKHSAYIDMTMDYFLDSATQETYMALQKSMAVIATGELDIIVGDTSTIDYFSKGECFHDITEVLPEDLLALFEDKLYYAKFGESEELIPVGIYVTDAPKLYQYYGYAGVEPILSFVINSNSIDNAISFLRYLYIE